jgi:sugar lactone lactonase YvrE
MRSLTALLVLGLVAALGPSAAGVREAEREAERERWHTRVLSSVGAPGFPAYAFAHRNGRVYAGTYTNPSGDSTPSLVREWTADGTLQRTWSVPGQDLSEDHGVQVANQDRRGRLVLLEKSTARVMTLSTRTGRFRTWARLPDLPEVDGAPIPNYATWGPGGALFVTDYGQAVVWRLSPRTREPRPWFTSPALQGAAGFGTTGIVFRPRQHDLLITQQTVADGSGLPTDGALYRLPIRSSGRPGALSTVWTSRPGDLPDGFGLGRSGRIYVANAGPSNQLVVLSRSGEELERFPEAPGTGENGSSVPFDTPSNATFLGRRLVVANQSFSGDTSHHALLDVFVGERGVRPYLPRSAVWR